MRNVDAAILLGINSGVGTSWTFDYLLMAVVNAPLLKCGVLVALLWWSWERTDARLASPTPVRGMLGAILAVIVARALQNFLPARERPMHDAYVVENGFKLADFIPPESYRDWSSFPSDHAVLAFALAMAVFLAHRGVGLFAMAWALLVVCLPRVYFGFHFPTDILGGAAAGIAVMAITARFPVPERAGHTTERMIRDYRGWYYAGLFLVTYLLADVFSDARELTRAAKEALSAILARQ